MAEGGHSEEAAAPSSSNSSTTNGSTEHRIQNHYTFWYHRRRGDKKNVDYNESTKIVESFGTIEQFWQIYDHIVRPNDFKVTTDYHLFKKGIKPTWEDAANNNGGKWMVRLKKGLASRYWEELVLAIIGEQFDVGHEICGAVVSVRNSEDIISVWNRNSDNKEATNKIRDQLRRILKLPAFISIEYKKHVDAKADGSSFRNPSMVWKASPRSADAEGRQGVFGGKDGEKKGFHQSDKKPRGEGRVAGWKDRGERNTAATHSSTGDPTRDAANAEKAREARAARPEPRGWGNSGGSGEGGSSRPAWSAPRARGGSDGDAGAPGSPKTLARIGDGGPLNGGFKRAPMPGIPPPLRVDRTGGKAGGADESPNVWTRASRVAAEESG